MHMFRILTLIAIQVSKWGQTKHSPVQNISTNHNWGMGVDFSIALLAIFSPQFWNIESLFCCIFSAAYWRDFNQKLCAGCKSSSSILPQKWFANSNEVGRLHTSWEPGEMNYTNMYTNSRYTNTKTHKYTNTQIPNFNEIWRLCTHFEQLALETGWNEMLYFMYNTSNQIRQ